MKIGIGTKDMGGTLGAIQVAKLLNRQGHDVNVFCNGVGAEAWRAADIPFVETSLPDRVLDRGPFDVWVSSMDHSGSIGFLAAERLRGEIRRVALSDYPTSSALVGDEWPRGLPDTVTVGGPAEAKLVRRLWGEKVGIAETGYPALSRLDAIRVEETRRTVRSALGISSNEFITVLCTNDDDAVLLTREFLRVYPREFRFMVRPHPFLEQKMPDAYAELQELLRSAGDQHIDTMMRDVGERKALRYPTMDVLCAADLGFSHYSTIAMEQAYLRLDGVNVFTPESAAAYVQAVHGIVERYPPAENGVVAEMTAWDQASDWIVKARSGELAHDLRPKQEQFYPHGTGATERVVEVVLNTAITK